MEITGFIKVLNNTEKVSEKFSKRLVVIETQDQYPQFLPVEFVQDKTSALDGYKIGDVVTVGINLRGSGEYKGKYYSNIQGWNIKKSDDQQVDNQGDSDTLPFN